MNRDEMLARVQDTRRWDLIVIGGGATGLGVAVESASRGYSTLLLEQSDFAKGTSSRSTKLVHGGVRYLQQGNVSLVLEALRERGRLRKNAPHLVHNLPFIVPNYDWWEGPYYGLGLRLYDMLAGKQGFGRSENLSREETIERLPTLEREGLRGGVVYYDGQFDDARLAVNLAQTAAGEGGALLNYMPVRDLTISDGKVNGVVAHDLESDKTHEIKAGAVINATGVFTDSIRRMENPDAESMITPSQGVHLVLDRSFLPADTAIMVPRTDDGRVLFAIPWSDCLLVGTTDTEVNSIDLEPRPLEEEIEFLITHAVRYLSGNPTREDVLSTFAGLRPLVREGGNSGTSDISRDHTLHISEQGLVTITGGKWTTYRKMAEDTVDQASALAQLDERDSTTKDLRIHGYKEHGYEVGSGAENHLSVYGSDAEKIEGLYEQDSQLREKLHPELSVIRAQVAWAAREEMARTIDDVLARRTRSLLKNARASYEAAPVVAEILAKELDRDNDWQEEQLESFQELAKGYMLT